MPTIKNKKPIITMTSTKLNSDPVKIFAVGTPDKIIEPQIKKTNDDTKNLFNIIAPLFLPYMFT